MEEKRERKKWEGRKRKEGKERARAGGDCGMRGPAGGVRGRVHAREEREEKEREKKERERFAAVGRDASLWVGKWMERALKTGVGLLRRISGTSDQCLRGSRAQRQRKQF